MLVTTRQITFRHISKYASPKMHTKFIHCPSVDVT